MQNAYVIRKRAAAAALSEEALRQLLLRLPLVIWLRKDDAQEDSPGDWSQAKPVLVDCGTGSINLMPPPCWRITGIQCLLPCSGWREDHDTGNERVLFTLGPGAYGLQGLQLSLVIHKRHLD